MDHGVGDNRAERFNEVGKRDLPTGKDEEEEVDIGETSGAEGRVNQQVVEEK